MSCKLVNALLLLCACGLFLQSAEAVIFTVGGLVLDSALAFLVFGKFLHFPLLLGKRSINEPELDASALGKAATPEEYLAVAASMDNDKCLPLAVCAAMARSRDASAQPSKFDDLIVQTFQKKLKEPIVTPEKVSPMNFYTEAARFGQSIGVVDSCRLVSPTCRYSMDELRQLTTAISQYQL